MKDNRTDSNMEYWLALSEKYFDASTTKEEEKALAQFLTSDAANDRAFDEIKAVMGYLSTGKSITRKAKERRRRTAGKVIQWASIAACVAVIVVIGTSTWQQHTPVEVPVEKKEIYYAYIDGNEYTSEDIAMQQMLTIMNKMSHTSNNIVEEQMEEMFRINK